MYVAICNTVEKNKGGKYKNSYFISIMSVESLPLPYEEAFIRLF